MPHYIYPPRPRSKIHPRQLPEEEARGVWLWQYKFNGDRCVAVIDNGKVFLGNRYGKFWPQTSFPELRSQLSALNLPKDQTFYLDGELLDNSARGVMVLFDILWCEKYLIGVVQEQRLEMLADLCGHPSEPCRENFALKVSDHLWLATHGDRDFLKHFQKFGVHPMIEGLLLRRKGSVLDNWGAREYEVDWQLRCRKPSKNYQF